MGSLTFKLTILNLTLLFWSCFSSFSGCSTNLKTSKEVKTCENKQKARNRKKKWIIVPVAIILSPGESTAPGGRMKQLLGAVVWNCNNQYKLIRFISARKGIKIIPHRQKFRNWKLWTWSVNYRKHALQFQLERLLLLAESRYRVNNESPIWAQLFMCISEFISHTKPMQNHTLNATWDLLVFFILTALWTCLPGSSSTNK